VLFSRGKGNKVSIAETLSTVGASSTKKGILSAPVRISDRNIGDEVAVLSSHQGSKASSIMSRQ